MRLPRLVLTSLAAALVGAVALPGVAAAAPPRGAYGLPTGGGAAAGSYDTAVVGFPGIERSTTSGLAPTTPTTSALFLNAATPFGAVFGTSAGQSYLSVRTGAQATTTVLTLASPAPAGSWGFALGDVDAESFVVTGTGADQQPLSAAELGVQAAFSLCGADPADSSDPGVCPGPEAGNVPAISAAGGAVTVAGTADNATGLDSEGASAWFRPTAEVTSVTLVSTRRPTVGTTPTAQLWVAALAATLSGTVTPPPATPEAPVAGLTVTLETPEGEPLVDPATDAPATTVTGPDGAFDFPAVVAQPVVVVVAPPAGVDAAPTTVPVDLSDGDVLDVSAALPVAAAPPVTPPTTPPATPTATSSAPVAVPVAPVAVTPAPQLAATGTPVGLLALGGGLLLAAGSGTVLVSRARAGR